MISTLNDINRETEEGKLLFAAIAKLNTESQTDKEPEEIIRQCNTLSKETDLLFKKA